MLSMRTSRVTSEEASPRIASIVPITRAEAFAPATVANLGVGFDILGLALREPGDRIAAEFSGTPGVEIAAIHGDDGKLPLDPRKNIASISAQSLLDLLGTDRGVRLTVCKGLPSSSGLGSSAASAVAAVVAVNALFGEPLTRDQLLPAAMEGEAAVSGYHADNVAPCLYGGITMSYGIRADQIVALPIPENLFLALVTPDIEVPTAQARAVLPPSISLRQMVQQTGAIARLIDAIHRADVRSMAAAMESDVVIEPARESLMPKLAEARAAAKQAGALGLVISGAGPTLCAICEDAESARAAAAAMDQVYAAASIASVSRWSPIEPQGAYVTEVAHSERG